MEILRLIYFFGSKSKLFEPLKERLDQKSTFLSARLIAKVTSINIAAKGDPFKGLDC